MGNWVIWDVLIPVAVLAVFWPVEKWVAGSTEPFAITFGTGELVLYASLLLTGVATHLRERESSRGHFDLAEILLACALLSMLVYGIIRSTLLLAEPVTADIRRAFASVGCGTAFVAIALGALGRVRGEKRRAGAVEDAL